MKQLVTLLRVRYSDSFKCTHNNTNVLPLEHSRSGVLEYWGAQDYGRPPAGAVRFKFKMDTDLYDLAKAKTRPCSITFSPDGKSMAVTARDKQAR